MTVLPPLPPGHHTEAHAEATSTAVEGHAGVRGTWEAEARDMRGGSGPPNIHRGWLDDRWWLEDEVLMEDLVNHEADWRVHWRAGMTALRIFRGLMHGLQWFNKLKLLSF